MSAYDVFISYTKRRDALEARTLAASLTEAGYSVWFDEQILNRKTSWRMESKENLIQLLKDAVHASRCVVLFAIEQAVISVPFDPQLAKETYQVVADERGNLIAWNWQIFEMREAQRTLVLYQSDDRRPEAVVGRLVRMNIHATRNRRAQKGLLKRTWARMHRGLNRTRRVNALLTPLPRPDSNTRHDEHYLHPLQEWMVVHFNTPKKERCSALIGEPGTGKTTLIDGVARSPLLFSQGRKVLELRLPALDDVDAWTNLVMKEPEDTILVFDDLSVQLEAYSPAAQNRFWGQIAHIAWRQWDLLFVFSPEYAGEFLKDRRHRTSRSELIPERIKEFHIADYSGFDETVRLVRWQWEEYVESGQATFQTKAWSQYRLVSVLDRIPVYSDLRPVNYRTLEGLQLSEPTKSLSVLKEAVEMAKLFAHGQVPCVIDSMFDKIVGSITGFPIGHSREHFDAVVSSIKGERFNLRDKTAPALFDSLERLVLRMNPCSLSHVCDEPAYSLCIEDYIKRRWFAQRLAEKLLGSEDAVLILDYEVIRDQILDPTEPFTETFRWMIRSVQRFPRWIIVFESLHKAPDIDRQGVRAILGRGEVFGTRHVLFDRCVLVFDTLNCLGRENAGIAVLS